MIESFSRGKKGKVAKDIWTDDFSRAFPRQFHLRAKFLLQVMYTTKSLDDLKYQGEPPALRLHKLKGDRKGELAIDIDKVSGWRITFEYIDNKFVNVGIEDYHKG